MESKIGNTVFFVESNLRVREATVLNASGDFYTIRLSGDKGAIRVRGSRLFATKEEALASLPKPEKLETKVRKYYED